MTTQYFTLTLETGNAAFEDHPAIELARILRRTADRIEIGGETGGRCIDSNGNSVGQWALSNAPDAAALLREAVTELCRDDGSTEGDRLQRAIDLGNAALDADKAASATPPPASPQLVDTVLCSVIESGMGDWFTFSSIETGDEDELGMQTYEAAMCREWDPIAGKPEGEPVRIDAERLGGAITKLVKGEIKIRRDLLDQIVRAATCDPDDIDLDGEAADCLVQIAMFDEIRYG